MSWRNPSGFLQADYGWCKKVSVTLQFLRIQRLQTGGVNFVGRERIRAKAILWSALSESCNDNCHRRLAFKASWRFEPLKYFLLPKTSGNIIHYHLFSILFTGGAHILFNIVIFILEKCEIKKILFVH